MSQAADIMDRRWTAGAFASPGTEGAPAESFGGPAGERPTGGSALLPPPPPQSAANTVFCDRTYPKATVLRHRRRRRGREQRRRSSQGRRPSTSTWIGRLPPPSRMAMSWWGLLPCCILQVVPGAVTIWWNCVVCRKLVRRQTPHGPWFQMTAVLWRAASIPAFSFNSTVELDC